MNQDPLNLYSILGVSPDSSPNEIKQAYLKRIRETHGDINGNTNVDVFMKVREAYALLSDPDKKLLYDEDGVIDAEAVKITKNDVYHNLAMAFNGITDNLLKHNEIDLKSFDILKQLRTNIITGLSRYEADISILNDNKQKILILRKQIKRKNAQEINLFDNTMSDRLKAIEGHLKDIQYQKQLGELMLTELEAYDSFIDIVHAWQTHTTEDGRPMYSDTSTSNDLFKFGA